MGARAGQPGGRSQRADELRQVHLATPAEEEIQRVQSGIEEHRVDHHASACGKKAVHGAVEQYRRHDCCQQDGQGRGEVFQYVVRILDDDGDQQAAQCIVHNAEPRRRSEATEKVLYRQVRLAHHQRPHARDYRVQGQLEVSRPQRHRRAFQQLLEVDPCEARGEAREQNCREAPEDVRLVVARSLGGRRQLGEHDRCNPGREQDQRCPMRPRQRPLQQDHAQHRRGQYLQLVQHRVRGRLQVRHGHELHVVLQQVEDRGDCRLERLLPVCKRLAQGAVRGQQEGAGDSLDHLLHDHAGLRAPLGA
mmetsp:Transcript_42358/g.112085  ORF Transcript_42358/g.112085 Transcript_42358/m.112085 type:complete len:306 (-) Transcript_42358:338-1255(-)